MEDILGPKSLHSLKPPSGAVAGAAKKDSSTRWGSQSPVLNITKEQGVPDSSNTLQSQPRPLTVPVSRPRGRPPSRPSVDASHITIQKSNTDPTVVVSNWPQETSSEKHTSKQKRCTADLPESHVQTRAR